MGLMKKLHDAFQTKDVKAMDQLMADDFIFVRHQSGTQVTKLEVHPKTQYSHHIPPQLKPTFERLC